MLFHHNNRLPDVDSEIDSYDFDSCFAQSEQTNTAAAAKVQASTGSAATTGNGKVTVGLNVPAQGNCPPPNAEQAKKIQEDLTKRAQLEADKKKLADEAKEEKEKAEKEQAEMERKAKEEEEKAKA